MKVSIVYDSSTGTTRQAAEAMGKILDEKGHEVQVQRVVEADPAEVAQADLICVGSWVQGWFIIKQHPTDTTLRFLDQLGDLTGKQTVVFCTYKLAAGSTLGQLARPLEGKGAQVVGQFKFRGPKPDGKFAGFATALN